MEAMTQKHIKSADGSPDLNLDVLSLKKAALILRAINHTLRQQLLKLLHQHGRMTVTEIYKKLRLEQSVASQHLAVLRTAGFVVTEREGKHIFYSVNYRRIKDIHQFSATLLS
jgi:ArsR family transcriptional regulator, virulence genes transcriptional regulator